MQVSADHDDCFRFDGCETSGPAGQSCMSRYHDAANALVSSNGTVVGEGHCCAKQTRVVDHVKTISRFSRRGLVYD